MTTQRTAKQIQKLPQLLATLPKDGLHALVRPSTWPEHQFFKITKTKLRFRPKVEEAGSSSSSSSTSTSTSASTSAGSSSSSSSSSSSTAEGITAVESQGGINVFGKAWGILYRNGKSIFVRALARSCFFRRQYQSTNQPPTESIPNDL